MEYVLLTMFLAAVAYVAIRRRGFTLDGSETDIRPTVKYRYRSKDFVMTKAENDFFNVLTEIVGDQYYVFPQMHLSAIFDHRVKGQTWKAAFSYINQKSVDYVVCDREYRRPVLGIELDDWSHDATTRKQRDVNVEHIFQQSGIPLLRLRDVRAMSDEDVRSKIGEFFNINTAQSNLVS